MVSFKSNDMRILRLTKQEQSAILEFCNDLIEQSVLELIYTATDGVIVLTKQQCKDLRAAVDGRMNQVKDYDAIDDLSKVFNKLSDNPAVRQIASELEEKPFETLEDIQGFADSMMEKQNNTPDPEMGGLSPKQVSELIYTDWGTPECPLKLNQDLSYEDVKNTALYHNAVALLNGLLELKDTPTATAKGNLNRNTVKAILNDFMIEEELLKMTLAVNKVLNEQDVSDIWLARKICQCAGLIRRQKNRFVVTRKAQKLIDPENAGKLYHAVFLAYFRKFSQDSFGRTSKIDGIQETMAFSIYQLNRLAKEESKYDEVYKKLVLPCFIEQFEQYEQMHKYFSAINFIRQHVIKPLMYAGLVECKYKEDEKKYLRKIDTIKASDLFQKYVKI